LGVAHNPLAVAGTSATELASSDKGRFGGAGISAAAGHGVGKIQARGLDPDQFFTGAWSWLGNVADLQNLGPAKPGYYDRLHRKSVAMVVKVMSRLPRRFADRYILFAINVAVLDGLRKRGLFIF
jgi:hypothetical protein